MAMRYSKCQCVTTQWMDDCWVVITCNTNSDGTLSNQTKGLHLFSPVQRQVTIDHFFLIQQDIARFTVNQNDHSFSAIHSCSLTQEQSFRNSATSTVESSSSDILTSFPITNSTWNLLTSNNRVLLNLLSSHNFSWDASFLRLASQQSRIPNGIRMRFRPIGREDFKFIIAIRLPSRTILESQLQLFDIIINLVKQ
jgi:hypothetical protein